MNQNNWEQLSDSFRASSSPSEIPISVTTENGSGFQPGNGTGFQPGNGTGFQPGNGTGFQPRDNDMTDDSSEREDGSGMGAKNDLAQTTEIIFKKDLHGVLSTGDFLKRRALAQSKIQNEASMMNAGGSNLNFLEYSVNLGHLQHNFADLKPSLLLGNRTGRNFADDVDFESYKKWVTEKIADGPKTNNADDSKNNADKLDHAVEAGSDRDLLLRFMTIMEKSGASGGSSEHVGYGLRAPQMLIPTFDGEILHYGDFKRAFMAMTDHANLTDVAKLSLLRVQLRNVAYDAVKKLDLVEKNYDECWKILDKLFHNKRRLIEAALENVVSAKMITVGSSDANECIRFSQILSSSVKSFNDLGGTMEDAMCYLAMKRIEPALLEKLEFYIQYTTSMPSIKKINEFFEQEHLHKIRVAAAKGSDKRRHGKVENG
jgi:hypothetical protein